jgi:hypothetical protein
MLAKGSPILPLSKPASMRALRRACSAALRAGGARWLSTLHAISTGHNFLPLRLEEAPRAEVGLDDVQFALSALQPRATVGPVSAVAVHSTLRRLHTVLCAIKVG